MRCWRNVSEGSGWEEEAGVEGAGHEEVIVEMKRREEEIMEGVWSREAELFEEWRRREGEVRKELEKRLQWVVGRDEEITAEVERLETAGRIGLTQWGMNGNVRVYD